MNASLRVGACLTLVPKFDPGEALATMQRDGVTHFYGVPTMYGALLHHPERESFDTSSLRICITGGASMPVEVLRGFEEAFGAIVLEGYGLSETSPVACSNHPDRSASRARSARRSKASRCGSSTRTTTRSPRARSARS